MRITNNAPAPPRLTKEQAREIENAELRWAFCKTFIEPNIKDAANDEEAMGLLPNHEFLIRNPNKASCGVKCRKTAWSWGLSLDCLARAVTEPHSTSIIGSYDEDEAGEKRHFLDLQYSVLPAGMRSGLKMSEGAEVRRFSNGSRIKFIARKAPTGAGAAIRWDEFSIEAVGRTSAGEILTAALGATTHTGSVSIGGTQRGPDTLFNKIVTGEITREIENNPAFEPFRSRMKRVWHVGLFPWWLSPALCKDVESAKKLALSMDTYERVDKFGNERLVGQFLSYCSTPDLGVEIFQREFECVVLDDRESFFSMALIASCYPKGHDYWFDHIHIDGSKWGGRHGDILADAKNKVLQLGRLIVGRQLEGNWGYSMDVGREVDYDEIWIGHTDKRDSDMLHYRMAISAHQLPFDGKEELLHFIINNLPVTRGNIDGTKGSLGHSLAERMNRRYGQRAIHFQFSNSSKQILAASMKARMERGKCYFPRPSQKWRKLQDQMLTIKKTISPSGNVLFDSDRNKGHHGDCFWSAAMLNDLFSVQYWQPHTPRATMRTLQPQTMNGYPMLQR